MGQAPWYAGSDKTFIDNTGLTDKKIGHMEFLEKSSGGVYGTYFSIYLGLLNYFWPEQQHVYSKKEIIEEIFQKAPELILVRERYVHRWKHSVLGRIVRDPRFQENYRKTVRINRRDVVYERKDLDRVIDPRVPPGAMIERSWQPKL
jgi:hypothetical protein